MSNDIKSNIYILINPDYQIELIFCFYMKSTSETFNVNSKKEMIYSLIQKETLYSSRRSVRLTKPPIIITLRRFLVIDWLNLPFQLQSIPIYTIAMRSETFYSYSSSETFNSLKIIRMFISNQGIFHFLKAQNQGKYTCPEKY